jgi:hypothetical protein
MFFKLTIGFVESTSVSQNTSTNISRVMQILFLMYHYFAAAEIYNYVRVCLAAYVFMTGFGNFTYYYVFKDFSLIRFAKV